MHYHLPFLLLLMVILEVKVKIIVRVSRWK